MKYNGKEYYSAGDLYNAIEQEIKNLKEKLSEITMVSDDEKQSIEHILELEQENKTLKLTLEQMENTCKDYLNDRDTLREDNRKLKLHIEAKDKAYTALLKDYEELKEDRKKILNEIEAEKERFKDFRKSLEK